MIEVDESSYTTNIPSNNNWSMSVYPFNRLSTPQKPISSSLLEQPQRPRFASLNQYPSPLTLDEKVRFSSPPPGLDVQSVQTRSGDQSPRLCSLENLEESCSQVASISFFCPKKGSAEKRKTAANSFEDFQKIYDNEDSFFDLFSPLKIPQATSLNRHSALF
eukprot:TRINITY_DN3985_c0_g1_i1.p1 TRINITY_DN3985_c0_g1~~TRINITY_DN3985_c0_g1_i1.p1  ORF type:complete len:162 (+),score=27.93 TRINITY_DN3985_c0_g1_i1:976-1461(+)